MRLVAISKRGSDGCIRQLALVLSLDRGGIRDPEAVFSEALAEQGPLLRVG
jgi:hypothetical protein